ncbi:three prime repair exonuclease 2-like [Protopterus annectens]|uniref:three prime repair exonuclease 2-like n=1 Tax=Protopterus annectens TaxID=7888 RepID=UPI001CFC313D|nr:three prime repair exonuclease 2-like [Protopterus annectens]
MEVVSDTSKKHFATYIFIDLESTGLPGDQPKITEICLIAVNRYCLENIEYTDGIPSKQPCFPRVVDKLCICIDPNKLITPNVSKITGLTNNILQGSKKKQFSSDVAQLLKSFIERQEQPVCMVAHNGYNYDFPLLKVEMSSIGCNILDGVYCTDSLTGMKALDKVTRGQISGGYSLSDLFFHFYQKHADNAHSADGDVVTLIMIFMKKAADLTEWIDEHSTLFCDITPMYTISESQPSGCPGRFRNNDEGNKGKESFSDSPQVSLCTSSHKASV